jgi:membrane-anchored protein YejM (alkaline phosphatase superfamily)
VNLLISLRYLPNISLPPGTVDRLFTLAAFVGHFASYSFLPCLIVVPVVLIFPYKRPIFALGVLMAVLLVFVLIIDTFVFSLFRFHFNGIVFQFMFGGAGDEIFTFNAITYVLGTAVVLGVVILESVIALGVWRFVRNVRIPLFGYLISGLLTLTFIFENVTFAWADIHGYTPIMAQELYLPFYYPLTARSFVSRNKGFFKAIGFLRSDSIGDEPMAGISGYGSGIKYPLSEINCDQRKDPMNVLLIIVESWRFDMLDESTTPNMHGFSSRSWNFMNHYSGGVATRPGIMSLFYGIPATYQYWMNLLSGQTGPVMFTKMQEQGYEIGVFSSAKLVYPEFDRTVFSGIEGLRTRTLEQTPYGRDRKITEEFVDFLGKRADGSKPFFGFLFFDSPHMQSIPPDYDTPFRPYWDLNYIKLNNDFDPVPVRNRYRNSLHFVDTLVGDVIEALDRTGRLDDTVVVITSDHGEEFNENGLNYWGHGSNFSKYQTRVPFIVHWPGAAPNVYTHLSTHLDFVPTVMMDVLGCEGDASVYSAGRHILDETPKPYVIIGGHVNIGVIQPSSIIVVTDKFFEIRDHEYESIPGARPDPAIYKEVMNDLVRFYR